METNKLRGQARLAQAQVPARREVDTLGRQIRSGHIVTTRFAGRKGRLISTLGDGPRNPSDKSRVNGGRGRTRAGLPWVEDVDRVSANERLTQVNIAWLRRNGCSSEQSISCIWKTAHRCQEPNGLTRASGFVHSSIRIRVMTWRARLEIGLGSSHLQRSGEGSRNKGVLALAMSWRCPGFRRLQLAVNGFPLRFGGSGQQDVEVSNQKA